jgi:hypothetical protein
VSAPILLPAEALPGLLRAGTPILYNETPGVVLFNCDVNGEPGAFIGGTTWDAIDDEDANGVTLEDLSIDLRVPEAGDAIKRAIRRVLHPGMPEPFNAPRFSYDSGDVPHWLMHVDDVLVARFMARPCFPQIDHGVPALADVPLDSPDRDLLALRCVALAVGGAT